MTCPRVTIAFVTLAGLLTVHGCSSGDGNPGGGPSGGNGGSGGVVPLPEVGSADRANISYADNLLQKVEDGEWTLGEGLVATLQAFVGEREASSVLRYPELNTYEGTGVFWLAREYLEDGPDADAQTEIARLLSSLGFSIAELEEMAGLITNPASINTKSSTENCLRFFDGFIDFPPGVGVCLEVESVTIGEHEHRIFFPADPLPSAGWDETYVSMAVDALADSIPVYDAIGEVPAISIVYSAQDVKDFWGHSFPTGSGECAISIYTGVQSEPQDRFQQLLAHEIAHCFQGETWPLQHQIGYDFIKWHFEGGAEYWSNLVYPEVNLEWRHLPDLERYELLTMLHNRSYENFIFFQYLGSTIGNEGIVQIMQGLPDTPDSGIVEQREALAAYPDMEQIFHDFVQALTDGAVQDTSGAFIPYAAPSYHVELFGEAAPILTVPLVLPFATYRFLLIADENEQVDLSFRETGTMTSSARLSTDGVATGDPGIVTESIVATDARSWSSFLPSELPERECDSAAQIVVVTTSESPTQTGDGGLTGASFELEVTGVDDFNCCLHGRWLMNNEDLGAADTENTGYTTTYSGQLTAEYRRDGTVSFVWSVTRMIDDIGGVITDGITGGGVQFYETPLDDLLVYSGPEITLSIATTSNSGEAIDLTARLDTGLGDAITNQFFECSEDQLVTIIRGDDVIGWQRMQ